MQNRFTHYKEKYKLLVNLKVQLFLFFFCYGLSETILWLLPQIKEKGNTSTGVTSEAKRALIL